MDGGCMHNTWEKYEVHIKLWLRNPKGRPSLRLWHRWEDNTTLNLKDIGWEGVHWIHLDQERIQWRALVNMALNL
jgi:hypothetical protein